MTAGDHHWITIHRARFGSPVSAQEHDFGIADSPGYWRFCPSLQLNEDGLPTGTSDIWCAVGLFDNREDAEAAFSEPVGQLPFLSEAVERWDALTVPVTHHGDVNWRGQVERNSAIRAAADDPRGPLAVITTAGFDSDGPEQLPRVLRFLQSVTAVVTHFGQRDENVRRDVFEGSFEQRDGFTLSLWRNDGAMMQAAYRGGQHRDLLDDGRSKVLFDRSSFTRVRILTSDGAWDGDPMEQMLQ